MKKEGEEPLKKSEGKWLSLIEYLVLSYAVAILTIVVLVGVEGLSETLAVSCFSVIFSTNACFVITTYWSMKVVGNMRATNFSLAISILGILMCGGFSIISALKIPFNSYIYWAIAGFTCLICLYLAYQYITLDVEVNKVLNKYNENNMLKNAEKIIEARKKSASVDTVDEEEYKFD